MKILGIESSCDETGLAIYDSEHGLIAPGVIHSQTALHEQFGGVVPELASRDHVRKILPILKATLAQANLQLEDLDGIAYTKGPGLAGALMVGTTLAKSLSYALSIPSLGIHHMEGHMLAPMLEDNKPSFPFLALLVSGGHTMIVHVTALGQYDVLGESIDDAAGEAFDKSARLLGLPYPGGPELAKLALKGRPNRFNFPRPMANKPGLDFSFSGLKTSVRQTIEKSIMDDQIKADIARAVEEAIVDILVIKCKRALEQSGDKQLIIAGGVSANQHLRIRLSDLAYEMGFQLFYPRPEFCTDNGAMIAYVGCQRMMAGEYDDLSVEVKPRWGLETRINQD